MRTPCGPLNFADLADGLLQGGGHLLMHEGRIAAFDEIGFVAIAHEKIGELRFCYPRQHRRPGDLISVEVKHRQDRPVALRVQKFVGVPTGGQRAGFGFSIAEDLLYGLQFGPETYVVRRIFGGFAHASFTSLTGIGIGFIPLVDNRVLKMILPVLGLSGAILLHAAFNFTATVFGPVAYLVLLFVILVYIVIIIVWLAIERRAIRDELRNEVQAGTITSQEYNITPSYFRRTGYYLGLLFTGRLRTWFRVRKLHSAAVDLALAKRLARRTGSPGSMYRVRMLRQKILGLREGATVRAVS